MPNVNVVVISGNLTRDPELHYTSSDALLCKLRVAVNARRKSESGEWEDKPNYFDVAVWGRQAESCANYLAKGRAVALEGRLDWRQWEDKNGAKRESVEILAGSVQFLGSRAEVGAGAEAAAGERVGDSAGVAGQAGGD